MDEGESARPGEAIALLSGVHVWASGGAPNAASLTGAHAPPPPPGPHGGRGSAPKRLGTPTALQGSRGTDTLGRLTTSLFQATHFMASFPHLLLAVFLTRGLTLPRATEGLTHLFMPDVSGSRIRAPWGPGSGSTRAGAPAQPSSSQPPAVGAETWPQGGAAWGLRGQARRGESRTKTRSGTWGPL